MRNAPRFGLSLALSIFGASAVADAHGGGRPAPASVRPPSVGGARHMMVGAPPPMAAVRAAAMLRQRALFVGHDARKIGAPRGVAVTIPAPPPGTKFGFPRWSWHTPSSRGGVAVVYVDGAFQIVPVPVVQVAPTSEPLVDESAEAQGQMVVDDSWLGGAMDWIREVDDPDACFDRMREIGELGRLFSAEQVGSMLHLCGDDGEDMLHATQLLGRYIVDAANAPRFVVHKFDDDDNRSRARGILRDAGLELPRED